MTRDHDIQVLERLMDDRCPHCLSDYKNYPTLYLRNNTYKGITTYDVKCEGCKIGGRWVEDKTKALESFFKTVEAIEAIKKLEKEKSE